ncbi:MAG: endonuclease Q family protein [Elusimicrobiota bacterium]
MKFIADFHIHSHYSMATSKKLTPEHLDYWAKIKGINIIGTGDCIHPGWLNELKEKLEPCGNGLFKLKPAYILQDETIPKTCPDIQPLFMLTGEISSIYKKAGKVRKVHNVCVFPSFEAVEKVQSKLDVIGNIRSDGRPILGLDAKNVLELTLESAENSFVIPAHIWTPWFSVLGAKSGFDNLEECYEDLTKHIFAVETGLSSDPPMNWACSFLDKFRLVSNSDCHSPDKLGREANIFDTELSYNGIYNALKNDKGFIGTIEFFSQEGKYHYDGHRKCNISWDPLETLKHGGICAVCGKPVTKGVMYRVAELADRNPDDPSVPKKIFYSKTSLINIIAETLRKNVTAKAVAQEYFKTINLLGCEFDILLNIPLEDIKNKAGYLLAEALRRQRLGEIHIVDGFDGEFGHISMFKNNEIQKLSTGPELLNTNTASKQRNSVTFNIKEFKKQQLKKKKETEPKELSLF